MKLVKGKDYDGREWRLGLLVREVREGGYYHVMAEAVRIFDGPAVRHDSYDYARDHLTVCSQGTDADGDKPEGRHLYGWEIEYRDVYSVRPQRARVMAQTLTKAEKALAKLNDARGYAHSFAEFLGRVAEALGAAVLVFDTREQKGAWDVLDVGQGVDRVAHFEARWRAEGQPKEVVA